MAEGAGLVAVVQMLHCGSLTKICGVQMTVRADRSSLRSGPVCRWRWCVHEATQPRVPDVATQQGPFATSRSGGGIC